MINLRQETVIDAKLSTCNRRASSGAMLGGLACRSLKYSNNDAKQGAETNLLLRAYVAEHRANLSIEDFIASISSDDVRGVVSDALAGVIDEATYQSALTTHRPALQQAYAQYFEEHQLDAVIFLTTPLTAQAIADSLETVALNGERQPTFPTYIRNTDPSSNAGIPGISLPAGVNAQGAHIGMELDGPAGQDRALLALALALAPLLVGPEM